MTRRAIILALLLCTLTLTSCGFANNYTGRVVRAAPQIVLNGARF